MYIKDSGTKSFGAILVAAIKSVYRRDFVCIQMRWRDTSYK